LEKQVKPRLQNLEGEELLKELDLRWRNHQVMVRWMQRFFQYLDRYYVEMSSIGTLTDQGFFQFKLIIFGQMAQRITQAILQLIQKDRNGDKVDSDLLKSVVGIFSYLNNEKIVGQGANYLLDLENKLVEDSVHFYKNRSLQMIQSATLVDYLSLANDLLKNENHRLTNCLTW
jgi:cullin 1